MANNFECPSCKKEYFIPEYSYNGVNYKNKYRDVIVCADENCKQEKLIPIPKEFQGYSTFNPKIANMSPSEKGAYFKKRSQEHSQRFNNSKDVK